jgi:hypothetical protein
VQRTSGGWSDRKEREQGERENGKKGRKERSGKGKFSSPARGNKHLWFYKCILAAVLLRTDWYLLIKPTKTQKLTNYYVDDLKKCANPHSHRFDRSVPTHT